ncbi:MAG: hypothetical protein P8P30_02020 [Rickettsiales bacterium]|nr:hypothetical protein [Rickettsiales bacterium]
MAILILHEITPKLEHGGTKDYVSTSAGIELQVRAVGGRPRKNEA